MTRITPAVLQRDRRGDDEAIRSLPLTEHGLRLSWRYGRFHAVCLRAADTGVTRGQFARGPELHNDRMEENDLHQCSLNGTESKYPPCRTDEDKWETDYAGRLSTRTDPHLLARSVVH